MPDWELRMRVHERERKANMQAWLVVLAFLRGERVTLVSPNETDAQDWQKRIARMVAEFP
jgi:hypothetical protein